MWSKVCDDMWLSLFSNQLRLFHICVHVDTQSTNYNYTINHYNDRPIWVTRCRNWIWWGLPSWCQWTSGKTLRADQSRPSMLHTVPGNRHRNRWCWWHKTDCASTILSSLYFYASSSSSSLAPPSVRRTSILLSGSQPAHYGNQLRHQVTNSGKLLWIDKRVAPAKEGAIDKQCPYLGEGKLWFQTGADRACAASSSKSKTRKLLIPNLADDMSSGLCLASGARPSI